ncbi:hypothetical protein O7635_36880 [Asanoa sp. WMMD1127]|uniref:hypothetical protein n=1 Tax=Asanoa sp. WMMD1127 TaxID=3016107 RepID=UPI002416453D|nr:hypothetical protein [Asanoa sp. WMMD1127]MDG4827451.1 hypothetical protein [Asanoa sp. WMMD1127]
MTGRVVAVEAVPAARFLGLVDELETLYGAVFTRPPWNETADTVRAFVARLPADTARPGFTAAVMRNRAGALTGFAYGCTTPGRRCGGLRQPEPDGLSLDGRP